MRLLFLVVACLLAASVSSVGAQPREQTFNLGNRVFLVGHGPNLLGTGFRICKPDVVLTAAHVIEGVNRAELRVIVLNTGLQRQKILTPIQIEKHEKADVAALFLKETDTAGLQCFNLGVPSSDYPGLEGYLLAEEIWSYGFPLVQEPFRRRMMKGHIQSRFWAEGRGYGDYQYAAYELSFPSFGGMSGSPVFRHAEMSSVIAVLTANLPYEDKTRGTRADWAISVALPPLAEWLAGLATLPDAP